MKYFLFSILFIFISPALANTKHEAVRRVVVFPFLVEKTTQKEAEEAWWDVRERLTESRRFLVASKNFMQAKDVFQPRGELKPADAIILGRLLDANALITVFVTGHTMSMRVYESLNGMTLWSSDIEMHVALPVSKQIQETVKKLLYDFIASIPYQGFVVVDSMVGRPTYVEGERILFKADVGIGSQVSVGDTVELINIKPESMKPLFQEGLSMEVFGEGVVVRADRNIVTIQLTRKADNAEILSESLVRVPRELKRLKEIYGIHESQTKNMSVTLFRDEIPPSEKELEKKPLVTSLAWLANLTIMLLLAF